MLFKLLKFKMLTITLFTCVVNINAQFSFCGGNSGDPIFTEDFGTGNGSDNDHASLSLPASTSYSSYTSGSFLDGQYAITTKTDWWFEWADVQDHTSGDVNGRCLVVNADASAGEFFRLEVDGLCELTTYEFTAWYINLNTDTSKTGINVGYEIWDETESNLLSSADEFVANTSSPSWQQRGLVFTTDSGQDTVILILKDVLGGGDGNDLAIDDIVFRTCGDDVPLADTNGNTVSDDYCELDTVNETITATPDGTVFSTYSYQWQTSTDNVNWTDVGTDTDSYTYSATTTTDDDIYVRVKVAENSVNLVNENCVTISDYYTIVVNEIADDPIFDTTIIEVCGSDTPDYSITKGDDDDVINWYSSGGVLVYTGEDFDPGVSGIYDVQAVSLGGCESVGTESVEFIYTDAPSVQDEAYDLCGGDTLTLYVNDTSGLTTLTYLWSTGDSSDSIDVTAGGEYTVDVTNGSCSVTKTITVTEVEAPNITSIKTTDTDFTITTSNSGDFEYSIDGGVTYQSSKTFEDVLGGLYTIYARNQSCTAVNEYEFYHLVFPSVFTPNGDGYNDFVQLNNVDYYEKFSCVISDKYGKILYSSYNEAVFWDGTYDNLDMPSDDYWYQIILDNKSYFGSFTLKRYN